MVTPKFGADLLIQQAGNDERHHLPLAAGEGGVTVSQPAYIHLMIKHSPATLDRLLDGAQQRIVAKRLGKGVEGCRLHGLDRLRNVTTIRNEDDRHVFATSREMLLQIKAIEAWKRNVENETTRHKNSFVTQEFLRDSKASCWHQALQSSNSRMETSSSTTNTIGVACDIADDLTLS